MDLLEQMRRLAAVGFPGHSDPSEAAFAGMARAAARIGTPRAASAAWTPAWDNALTTWMEIANLEHRIAAAGWIDPAVVAELRAASGG